MSLMLLLALAATPCVNQTQRSSAALAAVLQSVDQPLFRCLHAPANRDGAVDLHFSVLPSGEVHEATTGINTLPESTGAATAQCMVAIVQKLRFAPVANCAESVRVRQTFRFPRDPSIASTTTVTISPDKMIYEGGLSKEEIQRSINKVMDQIKRCYDQQLLIDPWVAGKVAMFFTIDGDGSVSDVAAHQNTFRPPHDATMAGCVGGIISKLKFPLPKGGGVVSVTYPFNFVGSGGENPPPPDPSAVDLPLVQLSAPAPAEPSKSCRGGVSRATIAPVVSADLSSLRSCYQAALQRTPTATGQVTATFAIATDGVIRDLSVMAIGNTLSTEAASLTTCVTSMMQSLRWPASPHRVYVPVTQTFSFTPMATGPTPQPTMTREVNDVLRDCARDAGDGELDLRLVVEDGGKVGKTEVINNWFDPRCAARVAACIQVAIKAVPFPSVGIVEMPFAMQDGKAVAIDGPSAITIISQ